MRVYCDPGFHTEVKIIMETFADRLEKKINDFIKDKNVVSVQYIHNDIVGAMITYRVFNEEVQK
jgi:hypothetical protein